MNNNDIKAKILSGVYKINIKRGRSKVWDYFGHIIDDENNEIPNFIACKICNSVYKYSKYALSNMSKHKCFVGAQNEEGVIQFEVNGDTKKRCTEVLTEWVVGDIRPYALAQDRGLKEFTKVILEVGHKHGRNVNLENFLPHPTTIYRNVEQRFKIHFSILKTDVTAVAETGYALTSDVWTDNFLKMSFLAVTIHYIKDSSSKNKLLGIKSMKGLANTSKLLYI